MEMAYTVLDAVLAYVDGGRDEAGRPLCPHTLSGIKVTQLLPSELFANLDLSEYDGMKELYDQLLQLFQVRKWVIRVLNVLGFHVVAMPVYDLESRASNVLQYYLDRLHNIESHFDGSMPIQLSPDWYFVSPLADASVLVPEYIALLPNGNWHAHHRVSNNHFSSLAHRTRLTLLFVAAMFVGLRRRCGIHQLTFTPGICAPVRIGYMYTFFNPVRARTEHGLAMAAYYHIDEAFEEAQSVDYPVNVEFVD